MESKVLVSRGREEGRKEGRKEGRGKTDGTRPMTRGSVKRKRRKGDEG